LAPERHWFGSSRVRGPREGYERHARQGSREERREFVSDAILHLILARLSPTQEDEPSGERRL
ncbi:MAG: hypothetical protein ACRDHF_03580, partial [Tepidiformaceae bacterium]